MDIMLKYLAAEDKEMAEHLAPAEELAKLSLPHHRGILAAETDTSTPCALMIFSTARENRLDIEWINVHEIYRGEGIGTSLVKAAFAEAEKAGIPNVGVRLAGDLVSPENVNAVRAYFYDWGFDVGVYVSGDWEVSPADYDASEIGSVKPDRKHVASAEIVDKAKIRDYLRKNQSTLLKTKTYDFEQVVNHYDDYFSMVYANKGVIEGVLLVEFENRVIYPLLLDAQGDHDVTIKLLAGLRAALADEEDRYRTHVISTEQSAALIGELFSGKESEPTCLWVCSVENYKKNVSGEADVDNDAYGDVLAKDAPEIYKWVGNDHYGDL